MGIKCIDVWKMHFNTCIAVFLFPVITTGLSQPCTSDESITFEKFTGVRPDHGEPVFLYAARSDEASLAGVCTARCRELTRCAGVAVLHGLAECKGYAYSQNWTLRQDNEANYFVKICLQLPYECKARWWALETTPGYHLHIEEKNVKVILNVTATDCSKEALHPFDGGEHRSAQWMPVKGGNSYEGDLITINDTDVGNCVLNPEDKYTEPESYRVANFRTQYKENQCRHDFPAKIERCSYEEYFNQTLKHADLELKGLTKDECKSSCEREIRFVCRGFSWRGIDIDKKEKDVGGSELGHCSLHSEDMLTLGSWLLRRAPGTSYYRRVVCLNISVECTDDQMVVTYRPRGVFRGRVYVPGRGERCGADAGSRGGEVRLALPLQGLCDVNFAYAISKGSSGTQNKTMAYAMVMIQNNPIIQTAGDRWVRVGCAPGARAAQSLDAALTVSVDNVKATSDSSEATVGAVPASAVFNASGSLPPPLTMYVVRPGPDGGVEGEQRGAVSLGEILELRVETTDENEIEVYHLVASSRLGDSSVLLLDNRGCPTGQVDFPGFARSWVGARQRLTARFKAFRFPNSHIVRFALMVRFCKQRCPQISCGPNLKNRSARDTNDTTSNTSTNEIDYVEAAEIREDSASWDPVLLKDSSELGGSSLGGEEELARMVLAQSGASGCGARRAGRVPLELELVVGSRDLLTADTLVRAEHNPIEDATSAGGALVCMHEILVVGLVLAWLIVQLLLLAGCWLVVKRYRNFAEMSSQKDYQSFDNVGFDTVSTHRRVHWPDQNVDILHD